VEGNLPDNYDRDKVKANYEDLVKDGKITFTTFHQSMSYEDFIEGIKPSTSEIEDNQVTYKVEDGIFKRICYRALYNLYQAIDFPENDINDNIEMDEDAKYDAMKKTLLSSKFQLTKELWDGLQSNNEGTYSNFVLIIDEINRGNVSQIFGELITLIEDDKRLGREEALEITLPYSKKPFGVPPNVYIIGTMNTADRSVEALDTALRRRFEFVEMPPNSNLINRYVNAEAGNVGGINLMELLEAINTRLVKLLDKDHMIGPSYFLSVETILDLMRVFQNKIIPLLQEYFYGDFGKIGLVLGKGFVSIDNGNNDVFAAFNYDQRTDLAERTVYNIKIPNSETDFQNAIQTLLRNVNEEQPADNPV
jgi:5-methylcytosine-specific restriction protein B